MNRYLLIESRDPFDSNDVAFYCGLAGDLARRGREVVLFLVQNGVLMARSGAQSELLHNAVQDGVVVLADEFSLRERGIPTQGLAEGAASSPLDRVVDEMAGDAKVMWH